MNKAQKTPSYKMTEIGRIPQEWDVRTLGEVCEITKNKGQESKFPYIEIGDIDVSSKRYIKKNKLSLKGCLAVGRETILISRVRPTRGAITLIYDDIVYASPAFTALKGKNVNNNYLFQYLAFNKDFFSFLGLRERGSTYPSCKDADILSYKIAVPLPQEQKKIASILSTVDEAIQKTDEIIKKAQELKRGLMQQLLTKGIGHTKFKQTEIGKIPEEWEVKKFEQVTAEIIDGDRGVNYPKQDEFQKQGFCLFLNTKNVPGEKFDFNDCDFISQERDNLLRKGKLNRGDIVLTTRGTVGNVALYNENVGFENIRINSGMVIIRNDKKMFDTNFLYLLLRSPIIKNQFLSIYTGSAQPQLPIRDIKKINLVIPPLPEQRKIASILSAVDEKIEKERQRKEQLEKLKKGLMQVLLTGRARVKVS